MLRLIELTYTTSLDQVDHYLTAHRAYLQKFYDQGYFIASGPKDPRDGGFILAVGDIDFLKKTMDGDPFIINKVAQYKIVSFTPVKCSDDFKQLLANIKNPIVF